ncbi:hypothetical protein [Desulfallas thermosapovorans]|nr:hypothetical protein [Desulfallas thermosapovorans]
MNWPQSLLSIMGYLKSPVIAGPGNCAGRPLGCLRRCPVLKGNE